MKKIIIFIILLLCVGVLASCGDLDDIGGQPDNMPYVPDTPAPDPHNGIFVSDHGTMEFNGDGKTVICNFDETAAKVTGLPEGEYEAEYSFMTGELPPWGSMPTRYDVAHELRITVGSESVTIDIGVVDNGSASTGTNCTTENRITFIYYDGNSFQGLDFIKSDN